MILATQTSTTQHGGSHYNMILVTDTSTTQHGRSLDNMILGHPHIHNSAW